MPYRDVPLDPDPLWYKDAVIYELHVRAFADSNGDGKGDFRGLIDRLDYLQDLGVTALWLLPFYPSPLKDDGYDIADYNAVHDSYGTLADAAAFVREAHRRGLRVITELVCNHTSADHPWFQRARRAAAGSPEREFYVFSDTPDRYREARIIFKDFETSNWAWDPLAKAYYWHRFYAHQPDLNFENPAVHEALFAAVDFWLALGIDGMRLDAIPYLYEREGTSCENLPETYEFLRRLRRHIDDRFGGRMLLAEANQWPEDAVAYFGQGDLCQMAFHFPLMPRLFMSIRMEDRFPILEILRQTPEIPPSCQWALFLRNHDELTLEMVTDEERDYMYQTYAQDPTARINLGIRRRLAPLLGNNRRQIELMNGLLFSLPGTPVLYYGDEIGMGDNIYLGDRNGVRTPMQWSADRNAGFSRANPQRLYLPVIVDAEYHYEAVNVEAQQNNPHSLLWWMKRLIALRKRYQAFGRGRLQFLQPDNHRVLAFLRGDAPEQILVVANLSRFSQCVELDLSQSRGLIPVEMFGKIEFPPISDRPYLLTLSPHSFYWFVLEAPPSADRRGDRKVPEIVLSPGTEPLSRRWAEALREPRLQILLAGLPDHLRAQRWFGGKARRIKTVDLVDQVPIPLAPGEEVEAPRLCLWRVEFSDGDVETYQLPLAFAAEGTGAPLPETPLCWLRVRDDSGQAGVLYDPSAPVPEPRFAAALLALITGADGRATRGSSGEVTGLTTTALPALLAATGSLEVGAQRGEQSNTSLVFGERLLLKIFRRIEPGNNPEWELGRYLTEEARATLVPRVAGALEYRSTGGERRTLGVLAEYVRHEGDGWRQTLDTLSRCFEHALTANAEVPAVGPVSAAALLRHLEEDPPEAARATLGTYLEWARLLGRRTAELHLQLEKGQSPDMVPEPFSPFYQRSIYQGMRNLGARTLRLLRQSLSGLPEAVRGPATALCGREEDVLARFRPVLERRIVATRTRYHGDYHLGQVLYTGKDFLIVDFEGEPQRPLSERRLKRSPLRDVAGMLRSLAYVVEVALRGDAPGVRVRPEDVPVLAPWARYFQFWASKAFLRCYLATVRAAQASGGAGAFLPTDPGQLEVLLAAYLLEKAIYELSYELEHRPAWVPVPLSGILDLLTEAPQHGGGEALPPAP